MAAEFGIFARRLGMSKVCYKYRVLVPSGKDVELHSQKKKGRLFLQLSEDTKHAMILLSKDGLSTSDFLGVMA